MREQVELWWRGIGAAAIGGGANAVLTSAGISLANDIGVQVPTLDWKQALSLFASGAVISLFIYLKQSPLPPK